MNFKCWLLDLMVRDQKGSVMVGQTLEDGKRLKLSSLGC